MKKQFRYSALIVLLLLVPSAGWSKSHVYFSPGDKPGTELIKLIDEAKKKIHAAVYMFTDNKIATALINAKKRKVDVQLIVDKTTTECMYGKAYFLQQNGIDVFVYSPLSSKPTGDNPYQKYPPLMHHKFAIIDKKLWTGSFNWTRSANYRNEENALLLSDQALQVQFEERFEMLKQKCVPVGAQQVAPENQEPLRTRMINFLNMLRTAVLVN